MLVWWGSAVSGRGRELQGSEGDKVTMFSMVYTSRRRARVCGARIDANSRRAAAAAAAGAARGVRRRQKERGIGEAVVVSAMSQSATSVGELLLLREKHARPPRRDVGIAHETEWNIQLQPAPSSRHTHQQRRTQQQQQQQTLELALSPRRQRHERQQRWNEEPEEPNVHSNGHASGNGTMTTVTENWECEIEGGGSWWRKKGVDWGEENGYRCLWTAMGGTSELGLTWKETWWEKSDWNGYKELGAEKRGEDPRDGANWGETWKESMRIDTDTGTSSIEKEADKWANYTIARRSWSEKWHERFESEGDGYTKSVEKCGSVDGGRQSWTERWGESHNAGRFNNWTDKWAENTDVGSRWGDKWTEDFDNHGNGWKSGETWRKAANSVERWSRQWGEEHNHGRVRKYGSSTSGERWDLTVSQEHCFITRKVPSAHKWKKVLENSAQLMAIVAPERPSSDDDFQYVYDENSM